MCVCLTFQNPRHKNSFMLSDRNRKKKGEQVDAKGVQSIPLFYN